MSLADTSTGSRPPLFSVVTVCYNAEKFLPATLASLAEQTFTDYEFIVIDGASSDGTLDILRRHEHMISLMVSEADGGIYDAMNKGIAKAGGQWLYFLNAGDVFHDSRVLESIASHIRRADGALNLIYGDVVYRQAGEAGRKVSFSHLNKRNLAFEHLCHQAVFANRTAFARFGVFDLRLKYNADFDWLLKVFKSGGRVAHVDTVVAFYDADGLTAKRREAVKAERVDVVGKYVFMPTLMLKLYRGLSRLTKRELQGGHPS